MLPLLVWREKRLRKKLGAEVKARAIAVPVAEGDRGMEVF
jgi:hypothetical protein